jgi:hypothetical protein
MAVAVAPTANSGTIAVRKYVAVPVHFMKTTIILTLALAGTACNAFRVVPIQRMVSKTIIPNTKTIGTITTRRTSFENSILEGDTDCDSYWNESLRENLICARKMLSD